MARADTKRKNPTARFLVLVLMALAVLLIGAAPGQSASSGSDNFNRPDGALGPGWVAMSDGALSIASQVVVGSAAGYAGVIRTAESYSGDQSSQVSVTATQLSGGQWMGPAVRAQNGGQDMYLGIYFWNNGSQQLRLYRRAAGSWVQLGNSYSSGPLAAGSVLSLSAVGSRVAFSLNGVEEIVVSDNGLSGGAPGIMTYGAATADNWAGADATAASTYSVGGTVSGLSGTVVMQDNGGDDLSVSGNGTFTFATPLANGSAYAVTVKSNPAGQTCSVSGGSGTVSSANVTTVVVACSSVSVGTGLVAAYSFDEGAGNTVADASGSGNTGTVANTTWVAGKFGGALSFNGSSSRVSVPDAASLDLTSGMTLEAWVDPAAVTSAWRDVIYKGNDNYYLEGTSTNGGGVPVGGGIIGGSYGEVSGTAKLAASTWTFLALSYDGATVRLFVNGTQVASMPKSGSLSTSTNPLQIGSDSLYGQYFNGLIDNVRVYNVALTAAQIQTDMTTPVGSAGGGDVTPPSVPGTLSASASSSSRVDLSWVASSDNVGVTGYLVERCQGAGCSSFSQVASVSGSTLSFSDTGLSSSTSYSYRVRATDAAGNLSGYGNTATASTPAVADTTPPSVPGTLSASVVSSARIDLAWGASTDNVGVTGYLIERCQGTGCTTFGPLATVSGSTLSYSDTGLSPSTSYSYRVRATDAANNLGTYSNTTTATSAASSGGATAADNFNRADGGLGASWTAMGDGGLSISSQVVIGVSGALAGDIRTGESYGSDQYSQVEVTSTQLSGGAWVGPAVRVQNGGQDMYLGIYFWNSGTPQLRLYRRSAGTWIQLGASYASGPLAAGTQLKLTASGSQISFSQNGVNRIVVSDGGLAGGAPGIMTFDTASADNWVGGAAPPSTFAFQVQYQSTDANGVATYSVNSTDNGGTNVLRVLAPTNPPPGVAHNFLFVLPVEAGMGTVYGDGLETLRGLDAQDQYNLTIIEPSFGIEPWYADNPSNASVQYETFLTRDLVPWVMQNLELTGHEQNWLIGFSKSGIGGADLILKHPDLFALAASWDFPADMSSYGQYGSSSANAYGTDANFQANYRLTSSFVAAHKAPFVSANRIWIGGYEAFATDMTDYDMLLTSLGILHSTETPQLMPHRWDGGWVPIALAALGQESISLPGGP